MNAASLHQQIPQNARKKLSKQQHEEIALKAAVLCALADELRSKFPVDESTLQTEWFDEFAEADATIETELQACLLYTSPSPRD